MAAADTIAAIATAQGRSGVGIVRVSGPAVPAIAQRILGRVPHARKALYGHFRDVTGAPIDQGIALYFPAPHSFTGEDVLELQGHGGSAVLDLVLRTCLAVGARHAEPGEFARRAFLNEKLDLAQAESIADLIDATTELAARSALRSLQGAFSAAVHDVDAQIIELRMFVEASIDFPEEDIAFVDAARVMERVGALQDAMAHLEERARQGMLVKNGVRLAIIGPPNVGKSSVLNRLVGEERAIVSAQPGTTRDTVCETVLIGGILFHLVDTAGVRPTDDEIELAGIQRALQTARQADVILMVAATDIPVTVDVPIAPGTRVVKICNKADLLPEGHAGTVEGALMVSAKCGEGIDALRSALLEAAGWRPGGEDVFSARTRHLQALADAGMCLGAARNAYPALDLMAEELREAHRCLGAITGRMTADDLLGEIFSRFCIGK